LFCQRKVIAINAITKYKEVELYGGLLTRTPSLLISLLFVVTVLN